MLQSGTEVKPSKTRLHKKVEKTVVGLTLVLCAVATVAWIWFVIAWTYHLISLLFKPD